MGATAISLIVCTHNNAARLRATLRDLARLRVDAAVRWELVLVNNACTDQTDAVAASFFDHLPMHLLHEPRPGRSRALNRALAWATGELIVFTDDDVVLPPNWLMCYWRAYRGGPRDCFFGASVRSRYEARPPTAPLRRIAPPSVVGLELGERTRTLGPGEAFIGANWAVPAAALNDVGGFDPRLGLNAEIGRICVGEESELMGRLRRRGWRAKVVPEAWIEHRVPAAKCRRDHIVGRRVAQFREEALHREAPGRGPFVAALHALGRCVYLHHRAALAPLLGRTGLLTRAQARGCLEAAGILLRNPQRRQPTRQASVAPPPSSRERHNSPHRLAAPPAHGAEASTRAGQTA